MAHFRKMVDMTRTTAEKVEDMMGSEMPSVANVPDVPYGLCICLTETELEKLDLEDDCEVGDMIHIFAMATVTSVSKRDTGDGASCRIELAISSMSVENETDEEEETEGSEEDD